MTKVTQYYVEGYFKPFDNEQDALKAEEKIREQRLIWSQNTPEAKYQKLIHDLKNSMYVSPCTIATCTIDAIAIKSMVKVCQKFAEDNKDYLNYY